MLCFSRRSVKRLQWERHVALRHETTFVDLRRKSQSLWDRFQTGIDNEKMRILFRVSPKRWFCSTTVLPRNSSLLAALSSSLLGK